MGLPTPRLALLTVLLLAGCAAHVPTRPVPSGQYAQTVDSATSGCLRSPGCYTQRLSEAPMPWVNQSVKVARTTAAVLRLLEATELARVEQVLAECARDAHHEVNDREFGKGQSPTRKQCSQVVRRENGQDVTRAMELGRMKHELALDCARRKLGPLFADNVSVSPRYLRDPAGQWRLLDPGQVAQWQRDGLFHLLLGTLEPDVVVHASGNPLQGQRVYDFKFPCLPTTPPSWRRYPAGHPHRGKSQDDVYKEAVNLGEQGSAFVTPQLGVTR